MKNSLYIILGLVILNFSCKKNANVKACCVLPISISEVLAQRNGASYETADVHGILNNDSLAITSAGRAGDDNNKFLLDSISVKFKYTGIGTYKLSAGELSYFTRVSSTVPYPPNTPVQSYSADGSYGNVLTISSYDQSTGIIKGSFSFKFIDPNSNSDISFSNGTIMFPLVN